MSPTNFEDLANNFDRELGEVQTSFIPVRKSRWVGVCNVWDLTASRPRTGFPFDPGEEHILLGKCDLLSTGMLKNKSKEGRLEGATKVQPMLLELRSSFLVRRQHW